MKHLITILAVFSLACLGAGVANAESDPPAGYDIINWVNIGDDTSETGHLMDEWSDAINPHWSNMPDGIYRQIWGPSAPATPGMVVEDYENWATIELDFTKPAHTGPRNLGFYYLAGAGLDNFYVDIDITGDDPDLGFIRVAEVEEFESVNTMVRRQLAVPDWVPAGVHNVRLECSEIGWGDPAPGVGQETYGQVTFDEIYTFTDPWVDPVITPVAVAGDPINCIDGTKEVQFHYTPGTAPAVKGYTVRVACDAPLTFTEADVVFAELPPGVLVTFHDVIQVVENQVYDVDYAVMDQGVGITEEADLFSVTFHGAETGTGTVSMDSADLRDLTNTSITDIVSDGTAGIPVDCDAPTGTFVINVGDPALTNSVDVALQLSIADATEMRFTNVSGDWSLSPENDWVSISTPHAWELLVGDGAKTVYGEFRDAAGNVLAYNDGIELDTTAPATTVLSLNAYQVESFFDVYYEIDLGEDGSDYSTVELFYMGPGDTEWQYFDVFVDEATQLVFNAGPTVEGTYYFYSKGTDNAGNFELPPAVAPLYDATTYVDLSDLTVNSFLINGGDTKTASEDVELSMDVVGATSMQFSNTNDGIDWLPDPAALYATTADWVLDPTTEGTRTVYARFLELPSNRWTYVQDDIIIDKTAPGNISDLAAERGLEKVKLTWTNPEGDQTGVEIWRAVWRNDDDGTSAYPEYDDLDNDVIPTIPGNRAAALADPAWTEVNMGTVDYTLGAFADLHSDRGIYYYVVFPVDGAGLYGGGNGASSISYLLGDVANAPYDGTVLGGDITVLSLAYGTTTGGTTYDNECDVGPTDDFSGSGIPATDSYINFDDLMIFALNWNILPLTKVQPAEGSMIARFSWMEVDDTTWSLVLTEPCANLKGVNLKADLPQDATLSVTAGPLLGQQESSYFLKNIPENGLDAGMALLGNGASITGQGELIRISLTGEFDPADILIAARDLENKDLEFTLEETTTEADMPTRYALSANYPNPFNPSTKIEFALPEAQHVILSVFAVDGRRIATLKNESLPAGHHSVTWTGRDDRDGLVAAGIYFYRIQAGEFSRTQKMTLVK